MHIISFPRAGNGIDDLSVLSVSLKQLKRLQTLWLGGEPRDAGPYVTHGLNSLSLSLSLIACVQWWYA